MKTIVFLLFMIVTNFSYSQVIMHQEQSNGQQYTRLVNQTSYVVGCNIYDQYNYYTFVLYPGEISRWYLLYGRFQWNCA